MKKITIIGITAAAVLVAAGGYVGYRYKQGSDFYAQHFYNGTKIVIDAPDGTTQYAFGDISGMTLEEAQEYVNSLIADYSLTVQGFYDTGDTLAASDVDLKITEESITQLQEDLAAQDHSLWFQHTQDYQTASCDVTLTLATSYDAQKVDTLVQTMKCVSPDEVNEGALPQIVYDEKNIIYQVSEGVRSNKADPELAASAVEAGLDTLSAAVDIPEEDYIMPELSEEERKTMQEKVDAIDKYLSASITVKDGSRSLVIDRSVIINFLDIDEEYNCTLNTKSVQKYVNDNFDSTFDTVGTTRTINTVSSGTVTVKSVTFGKVVRTLNEVELLTQEITDGETIERTPEYYNNYETTEENGGVGDTYIDVNISEQMVYVVIDGKIVIQTECVTGLDNDQRRTPTGLYYVIRKVKDYTMVKYNSFVNYWMPINDTTGVGLHDATWRSSFGGSIYKSDGSHGCINLPLSAAKQIYETIDAGIPVIVH